MHLEQRILVTGGSGFLGSHLCERLLSDGANVLCVDNFFSGARSNIEHLLDHKRFELIRHDVTFPLYVEVDQIYNLACPASPIHYQRDPVQTTKTSVHGAINMLGLAKRVRASILQASTSEVYGDPNVHPQPEDYWGHVNPIGPRSCYDEGKRCAETLFFDYRRQHKMPIKVARIFNTYGPRMHPNDGRVVSNFIMQALLGRDLTIYGDGSQTRSFCYVDDLIDGLVRLMKSPHSVTGPINIGNPSEFTILQLASEVIDLTGSRSRVAHRPRPEDDRSAAAARYFQGAGHSRLGAPHTTEGGIGAHHHLFRRASARCDHSRVAHQSCRRVTGYKAELSLRRRPGFLEIRPVATDITLWQISGSASGVVSRQKSVGHGCFAQKLRRRYGIRIWEK